MINFTWSQFNELSTQQLYSILALRSQVFVVEQQCPYLDPDGKDNQAYHLLGTENNSLLAYLRVFPPNDFTDHIVFGRVVVAPGARGKAYGKLLLQELMNYCATHYPDTTIKCSAQHYLVKFYEEFGLKTYGEIYDEDGIPHIAMQK